MNHHAIAFAASALLLSGAASAGTALAADQASRTILDRIDVAGTPKEAVIGLGEAQPGKSIGAHSHPGEELAYVISGTMTLKVKGKPDRSLHAGDTYTLPSGAVHELVGGKDASRVVVVWVVDKTQPLSSPAP